MIVIDPTRTFEFVPPSQAEKEDPGVLLVRALTVRERHRIYPHLNPAHLEKFTQTVWDVLELAVVGWRNFNDPNGDPIPFAVAMLDHLPDEYATGAYEYILELSQVTPEDAGK